jgi:hypothetical protein
VSELSSNAVLVDGLWFCVPKIVMDKVSFDESTFSGFHCYDLDICLQIIELNYEVRIVYDINIEHFSIGKRDAKWLRGIFTLYAKWKKILPIQTTEISNSQRSLANFLNAVELMEQIELNGLGINYKIKVWWYYLCSNPLTSQRNWIYFFRLINEKTYMAVKKATLRLVKSIV